LIGTSINHFEITAKVGEGGMGEVYRATDKRLNREVAIKVLPEAVAEDRDRLSRFQREAQLLAALNHPHIAAIHGLEEDKGRRVLVMELVEGEDLSTILQAGPIPIERSLKIALQLTEAIEAAHEKGVVHRDLKPPNIKITADDDIKVLDFGLAKALQDDPVVSSPDLSKSPTLSAAATGAGLILGTAGYMSPEQARGQPADRRADVWAFGVILYEMLTGRKAFDGATVSDVLARVLEREPDWDALPEETPANIRQLMRRCLEKDVRRRLQAVGEARILIQDELQQTASMISGAAGAAAAPAMIEKRSRAATLLPWIWAAAATVLLAVVAIPWGSGGDVGTGLTRLEVKISEQDPLYADLSSAIVLSPDGTRIAYTLGQGVQEFRLYTRTLDQLEAHELTGTDGGYNVFFSPDGEWIGFFTPSQLKKVPVAGGTPIALSGVNLSRGGTWSEDGFIIYAPNPGSGLVRVPDTGGEPEPLTDLIDNEVTHRWPQALPGGRGVLFTSHDGGGLFDDARIVALDLETRERKLVHQGGTYGRYVRSGHLLYAQEGSVFAVRFDLDRLEPVGSPVPVLQDVRSNTGSNGTSQFDVSDTGTLVYMTGQGGLPRYNMVLVDQRGRVEPITDDRMTFGEPRFSPDGNFLAVEILEGNNRDAWVYDLRRGVATRLTFDPGGDDAPVWSPDGEYIVFSSGRGGSSLNLYRKRADGSGDVERLTDSEATQFISGWSPDGKYLLYAQSNPDTSSDLYILPLEGGEPELYLQTPFIEAEAAFSPDGRWIAYHSNETGRTEVFVRPFPARGGKWQISVDGGSYPRWSRDGRKLYYRLDNAIYEVDVDGAGASFRAETPLKLIEGPFLSLSLGGLTLADYDVHPDGERFVMMQEDPESTPIQATHAVFVFDWFSELDRLTPKR